MSFLLLFCFLCAECAQFRCAERPLQKDPCRNRDKSSHQFRDEDASSETVASRGPCSTLASPAPTNQKRREPLCYRKVFGLNRTENITGLGRCVWLCLKIWNTPVFVFSRFFFVLLFSFCFVFSLKSTRFPTWPGSRSLFFFVPPRRMHRPRPRPPRDALRASLWAQAFRSTSHRLRSSKALKAKGLGASAPQGLGGPSHSQLQAADWAKPKHPWMTWNQKSIWHPYEPAGSSTKSYLTPRSDLSLNFFGLFWLWCSYALAEAMAVLQQRSAARLRLGPAVRRVRVVPLRQPL